MQFHNSAARVFDYNQWVFSAQLSERGKAFHKPLGAAAGEPSSKFIEKQEIPYNPAHLDLTLFGGVM